MRSSEKNPWKILPGETLGKLQPWQPPTLRNGNAAPEVAAPPASPPLVPEPEDALPLALPTLEEIEAVQRQAYDEGLALGQRDGLERGHQEGLERGRQEALAQGQQQTAKERMQLLEREKQLEEQTQCLNQLMCSLGTPFQDLDDQVERELLALVITMTRHLVRREIRTDPRQIVGVMREALAILPVSSRNIRVLLHPDDAVVIRQVYPAEAGDPGWKLIEDGAIERGGCRILADNSHVDATIESRLQNLIAPLLSGLRSQDEMAESA